MEVRTENMGSAEKAGWLVNHSSEGEAIAMIIFAHGAGAPMDSGFMVAMAEQLALNRVHVIRFEFGYMHQRRLDGKRRPPPKAEKLLGEFREVVEAVSAMNSGMPLFIGGKSMGGRIASLLAADANWVESGVAGCFCAGYPFHPPGKPGRWRTDHFNELAMPVRIAQGTRDPFGRYEEVEHHLAERLLGSPSLTVSWLESGEHDFRPTKASGRDQDDLIASAAQDAATWMRTLND
ncbi:alpha/beta family hydrolase [Marinobacter sp. BGYM27]|uniref:alpha/beta family hydrolase n=1 Tax=unclassified Marinobacter TaxID=83889 RepID=UPI0021A4C627|nr:alpha/beta family hydrolase [Marinobacter sp. BGYM27]MDG5500533.1 alpha/beta fold hydrolase [Marinobacter sp. BGYM27]